MLNLRIARGPLPEPQNAAILLEYNRLTSSEIPDGEFAHWVQKSPAGPAWHAILESETGEIVGHTCMIPLRGACEGTDLVAAKAEYSFVREEHRAEKISGFEDSASPKFIILTDQIFRRCTDEGWGPFLISTTTALHRLGPRVGCQAVDFPLMECLLVLRPWQAMRKTPNLNALRSSALGFAGLVHAPAWAGIAALGGGGNGVRVGAAREVVSATVDKRLSFFADASYDWRYPRGGYTSVCFGGKLNHRLTLKNGRADRYLRVCEYPASTDGLNYACIARLVNLAREQKALGIRWAVYGDDLQAKAVVARLRSFGFLCASRIRRLLIHSNKTEFLTPANWNLSDAMFSFDP